MTKAKVKTEVKTKKPTKSVKTEKTAKKETTKKSSKSKGVVVPETQVPNPDKLEIISQFQVKEGDTGSPEVQIALLTKRIEKLVNHLRMNPSDNHSRRGLLGIVSKRRRLINYLEKRDNKRYKDILHKLNLSK
jgi:small subunit ribosomal protein S15